MEAEGPAGYAGAAVRHPGYRDGYSDRAWDDRSAGGEPEDEEALAGAGDAGADAAGDGREQSAGCCCRCVSRRGRQLAGCCSVQRQGTVDEGPLPADEGEEVAGVVHAGGRPQDHEASSCCPPFSRRSSFQSGREAASEAEFASDVAAASDAEAAGGAADHCEDHRGLEEAPKAVQKHQIVVCQVRHLQG